MNERRISRLQVQIKARVAHVISNEMSDPRRGLITVTRVKLDRELMTCKIYWSVLGDEKERAKNARMLDHATMFVQREVARTLHTRTSPQVKFEFDESIAGALRIDDIISELKEEREKREGSQGEEQAETPPS